MTISKLIRILEEARGRHGDLNLYTFDGAITQVKVEPSIDGLDMIHAEGRSANELVLEVQTL